MRYLLSLFCLFLFLSPAVAAVESVTYYLDGARLEGQDAAPRGVVEIPLPGSLVPGSLRVKPLGGASIVRVETEPARISPKAEKEVKDLEERKRLYQDRLRALEVKEEIFKAAAKSQSSKAPRRTKNNPEPLETIRKGTEFAVTQLEDVYRARRKAEEGLKGIEERLTALRKSGTIGGSVARVHLAGKGGVSYSYLVTGGGWVPFYDFRLDGGQVELVIRAQLPRIAKAKAAVVSSELADLAADRSAVPVRENLSPVARFTFPVETQQDIPSLQGSFSFSFRNGSAHRLAVGEGACFREGEYVGPVRFEGAGPGEVREVVAGK